MIIGWSEELVAKYQIGLLTDSEFFSIKIIQSLQIIYIIPVRYATKLTTSTSDTGTIQYHKVQDASAQKLELPGISEQSF